MTCPLGILLCFVLLVVLMSCVGWCSHCLGDASLVILAGGGGACSTSLYLSTAIIDCSIRSGALCIAALYCLAKAVCSCATRSMSSYCFLA